MANATFDSGSTIRRALFTWSFNDSTRGVDGVDTVARAAISRCSFMMNPRATPCCSVGDSVRNIAATAASPMTIDSRWSASHSGSARWGQVSVQHALQPRSGYQWTCSCPQAGSQPRVRIPYERVGSRRFIYIRLSVHALVACRRERDIKEPSVTLSRAVGRSGPMHHALRNLLGLRSRYSLFSDEAFKIEAEHIYRRDSHMIDFNRVIVVGLSSSSTADATVLSALSTRGTGASEPLGFPTSLRACLAALMASSSAGVTALTENSDIRVEGPPSPTSSRLPGSAYV
ncbi:unnamed protein product [Phytophthora fragariaefolia]|uniref:Unnamed protein product n=1 Tax=Phytophthora fragariaefolia TaxID=1490495 RepID=A0A9W6YKS2_9STRA|nr:unnamed protein product [Phytophthora fragariaefolia]